MDRLLFLRVRTTFEDVIVINGAGCSLHAVAATGSTGSFDSPRRTASDVFSSIGLGGAEKVEGRLVYSQAYGGEEEIVLPMLVLDGVRNIAFSLVGPRW